MRTKALHTLLKARQNQKKLPRNFNILPQILRILPQNLLKLRHALPAAACTLTLMLALAACSQADDVPDATGRATLALNAVRTNVPQVASRAVDAGLAVQLRRPDGSVYREFAAGSVPEKIELEPDVAYTIVAYSDNQGNWAEANGGRGEACYWGTAEVSAGEDETAYCTMEVPMTNYAVALSLPENFATLFPSYTFSLASGSRTVEVSDGEKAYFSVGDGGFRYALSVTNTDGETFAKPEQEHTGVAAGMLYKIAYGYTDGGSVSATEDTEIR